MSGEELDARDDSDDITGDLRLERRDAEGIAECASEALEGRWSTPQAPLRFASGLRWRPHLIADGRVCHVLTTGVLSTIWSQRIDAACEDGYEVFVAGPIEAWLAPDVLLGLASRASRLLVVAKSEGKWVAGRQMRTVPQLVVEERLILAPSDFAKLARHALERALNAESAYWKGWYYEDFLALMFSQVSFLEVLERNFKNETQELDLVLRDRRAGAKPIALASGKNEKSAVGKNALVHLRAKMADRRGQCGLGFLCSAGTIARTTRIEDLGYRREGSVVVFVDAEVTEKLLSAPERLDDAVEDLILRAALT